MSKLDEVVIGYRVYEDATEFRGIAKIAFPKMEFFTTTITGAGIAGEYEEAIMGLMKGMRLGLDFINFGDNAMALSTPVDHNLDIREVQQARNMTTGKVEIIPVKHVVVCRPVSVDLGTLETATNSNPSGEYTMSYYARYVNGKKTIELDPLGYICMINGVDYLADVRKAMGL